MAACLVYCVSCCCGTIHMTCCHSNNSHNSQNMLPQHQLTQYTRHAATAPTYTIHKTCCHSTKSQYTTHAATAPTHTIHNTCCHNTNSHNTQDILPQHQLPQYTRHAATAPTHTIHKTCCHSTNCT